MTDAGATWWLESLMHFDPLGPSADVIDAAVECCLSDVADMGLPNDWVPGRYRNCATDPPW